MKSSGQCADWSASRSLNPNDECRTPRLRLGLRISVFAAFLDISLLSPSLDSRKLRNVERRLTIVERGKRLVNILTVMLRSKSRRMFHLLGASIAHRPGTFQARLAQKERA
jgi:hypothetical protein